MFNALRDMMKVPVVIKPCLGTDTRGDKTYGTPINALCCPEPRVTILTTYDTGIQEISEGLLYLDGDVKIGSDDLVVFEGRERTIKRLWSTYEHDRVSLWVVYF